MAKKRKGRRAAVPQKGLVPTRSYLDTIMSSRAQKQERVRRFRRKSAIKRSIAAACALVFCGAVIAVCADRGIIELEIVSSAIAATKTTLSLNEYESEYSQFYVELSDDVTVDIPGFETPMPQRQVLTYIEPEPEPEPQEVVLSTEAADVGEMQDEQQQQAAPKGTYPTIFVDGKVVCSPQSEEDAQWIRKSLLDSYTKPVAGGKPSKRGFANGFDIMYGLEEPSVTMQKEEAYLMLRGIVEVRLRENIEVTKSVGSKTEYIDDPSMERGKTKVQQEGKNGVVKEIYEVTSINGVETGRELIGKPTVVEQSSPKVVIRGTKVVATPKPAKPEKLNIPVEAYTAVAYDGPKSTSGTQKPGNHKTIPMPDSSYAFSGSNVGSGKYYPNIDTTSSRPGATQGVPGPSKGGLNFIPGVKGSIGSYFGWRYGRMHYGVDTFAPTGTPIVASEGGTVTSYTGVHNGYGNIVEIRHSDGFTTRYAHCDTINVQEGQKISKGQQIATVGSTGTQTSGPHLHFEIRVNGVPYNPLFYM